MAKKNKINFQLLGIIFCLLVFGLAALYSASTVESLNSFGNTTHYIIHQLIYGVGIGLIVMLALSKIDYHRWQKLLPLIIFVALALLAMVKAPGFGFSAGGAIFSAFRIGKARDCALSRGLGRENQRRKPKFCFWGFTFANYCRLVFAFNSLAAGFWHHGHLNRHIRDYAFYFRNEFETFYDFRVNFHSRPNRFNKIRALPLRPPGEFLKPWH